MADKQMCVYKITNTENGKFYIGSTNDLTRRKREHYYHLKKQKHFNNHLQASYNKHGIDCFQFDILFVLHEYLKPCLHTIEQRFIDDLKPEYNQQKNISNSSWYTYPKDVRIKIAESARDRECKPETRALLSTKMKVIANRPENIERVRKEKTGVPLSETTCKKISEALKGNTNWKHKKNMVISETAKQKMANKKAKDWVVIHPDGTREKVFNMVKYCRENNLNSGNMIATAYNKRKYHKGYKVEAVNRD